MPEILAQTVNSSTRVGGGASNNQCSLHRDLHYTRMVPCFKKKEAGMKGGRDREGKEIEMKVERKMRKERREPGEGGKEGESGIREGNKKKTQ